MTSLPWYGWEFKDGTTVYAMCMLCNKNLESYHETSKKHVSRVQYLKQQLNMMFFNGTEKTNSRDWHQFLKDFVFIANFTEEQAQQLIDKILLGGDLVSPPKKKSFPALADLDDEEVSDRKSPHIVHFPVTPAALLHSQIEEYEKISVNSSADWRYFLKATPEPTPTQTPVRPTQTPPDIRPSRKTTEGIAVNDHRNSTSIQQRNRVLTMTLRKESEDLRLLYGVPLDKLDSTDHVNLCRPKGTDPEETFKMWDPQDFEDVRPLNIPTPKVKTPLETGPIVSKPVLKPSFQMFSPLLLEPESASEGHPRSGESFQKTGKPVIKCTPSSDLSEDFESGSDYEYEYESGQTPPKPRNPFDMNDGSPAGWSSPLPESRTPPKIRSRRDSVDSALASPVSIGDVREWQVSSERLDYSAPIPKEMCPLTSRQFSGISGLPMPKKSILPRASLPTPAASLPRFGVNRPQDPVAPGRRLEPQPGAQPPAPQECRNSSESQETSKDRVMALLRTEGNFFKNMTLNNKRTRPDPSPPGEKDDLEEESPQPKVRRRSTPGSPALGQNQAQQNRLETGGSSPSMAQPGDPATPANLRPSGWPQKRETGDSSPESGKPAPPDTPKFGDKRRQTTWAYIDKPGKELPLTTSSGIKVPQNGGQGYWSPPPLKREGAKRGDPVVPQYGDKTRTGSGSHPEFCPLEGGPAETGKTQPLTPSSTIRLLQKGGQSFSEPAKPVDRPSLKHRDQTVVSHDKHKRTNDNEDKPDPQSDPWSVNMAGSKFRTKIIDNQSISVQIERPLEKTRPWVMRSQFLGREADRARNLFWRAYQECHWPAVRNAREVVYIPELGLNLQTLDIVRDSWTLKLWFNQGVRVHPDLWLHIWLPGGDRVETRAEFLLCALLKDEPYYLDYVNPSYFKPHQMEISFGCPLQVPLNMGSLVTLPLPGCRVTNWKQRDISIFFYSHEITMASEGLKDEEVRSLDNHKMQQFLSNRRSLRTLGFDSAALYSILKSMEEACRTQPAKGSPSPP